MKTLLFLIYSNLKMIYRNRQALFWALAFPLIFVGIFGLFRLDQPPVVDMLIVDHSKSAFSRAMIESLITIDHINVEEGTKENVAIDKLRIGETDYVLKIPFGLSGSIESGDSRSPVEVSLMYDGGDMTASIVISTVERFVHEVNSQLTESPTLILLNTQRVQSRQLTYFDFLLPGFVGMGVMTYAIIGMASTITNYRQQQILKRILATPLSVRTFFASQIIANLILASVQAVIILAAGVFIFGANVYGNILWILVVVTIANIVFLNIGFIVGAFAKNARAADGMANAIAMPMMFLSGTFFPTDSLPKIMSNAVEYLPLSPLLDAMRGVALEADSLLEYQSDLAILALWIVISSLVAIRVFRFG